MQYVWFCLIDLPLEPIMRKVTELLKRKLITFFDVVHRIGRYNTEYVLSEVVFGWQTLHRIHLKKLFVAGIIWGLNLIYQLEGLSHAAVFRNVKWNIGRVRNANVKKKS